MDVWLFESNHFPKDLVHHPNDNQPFINASSKEPGINGSRFTDGTMFRFQVGLFSPTNRCQQSSRSREVSDFGLSRAFPNAATSAQQARACGHSLVGGVRFISNLSICKPENHPFEKECYLPNTFFILVIHVGFRGCYNTKKLCCNFSKW